MITVEDLTINTAIESDDIPFVKNQATETNRGAWLQPSEVIIILNYQL